VRIFSSRAIAILTPSRRRFRVDVLPGHVVRQHRPPGCNHPRFVSESVGAEDYIMIGNVQAG
jgi:hypothetical protein